MTCKTCSSERIMSVYGKCNDLGDYKVEHLQLRRSAQYAPYIDGVTYGDEIQFEFCLDCGVLQRYKPVSDEQIKEAFEE